MIWGRRWDPLLAADHTGVLVRLMGETLDGDYQTFKSRDGAYVRENFFGKYPETRALVADWSDDDVWRLNRGGHDPYKVYAAYKAAVEHTGGPTVILAKTIKGYGLGTRRRRHEHRAQHEEARRRSAAHVPRSLLDSDLGQRDREHPATSGRPKTARR